MPWTHPPPRAGRPGHVALARDKDYGAVLAPRPVSLIGHIWVPEHRREPAGTEIVKAGPKH